MDIPGYFTFEEWFDLFAERLRIHHGYTGPIDKYSFESEYEIELKTPEAAAQDFYDEINEQ